MSKNNTQANSAKEILKTNGYKVTPTRLAVLDLFLKNSKPISALYICQKLEGKINEATVYRMLSEFEQSLLLKKVDLKKNCALFELNSGHHHHILCIKCGEIEDFKENEDLEKILLKIVSKSTKFKKIKEHTLELFGYCKVCG